MELSDMIVQASESLGADIVFGALVIFSFALVVGAMLFFLLAVRGAWRWLTRHTWGDVVRSAGRKALR